MSTAPSLETTLAALLGDGAVLAGDTVPSRHTHDWGHLPPIMPRAVVRPTTTDGVAATLRLCAERGVPVVPQGGLTGLCGGGRPVPGAVALSLERLDAIEPVDADDMTVTAGAGVPLETLQHAADDAGLMFAVDLGARGSCRIGGMIATNAGGNRVIRYGMTRDNLLGLEAVLADGTVVTALNRLLKNNAGYDLRQVFVGSEGTLGVVTRAVLRLHPKPGAVAAALCALPDPQSMVRLLGALRRALGPTLAAFEAMWPDYWDAMVLAGVGGARSPFDRRHGAYVLVEQHGVDPDNDARRFEDVLGALLADGTLRDAALARSLADVRSFWATRDAVSEFRTAIGPHLSFDIGLHPARIAAYADAVRARLARDLPNARPLFYGHLGDGNLHAVVAMADRTPPDDEPIERAVYETVAAHGGTISAEHGIGLSKKRWLPLSRSPAELDAMRRLKRAFDPCGLLNPGKVI